MTRGLRQFGEEGGEVGEEVGVGGVEDGAFGDDQVVGGGEGGEDFGEEGGGTAFDEISVDGEFGRLFGEEDGKSWDKGIYRMETGKDSPRRSTYKESPLGGGGGGDEGEVVGVERFSFTGETISFFSQGKPVYGRKWHFRALTWFGP